MKKRKNSVIDEDEIQIVPTEKKLKKKENNVNGLTGNAILKYVKESPENQAEENNWIRNPLPKLIPRKDSIVFQQMDSDYTVLLPDQNSNISSRLQTPPDLAVPVIRMFGCTEAGNSLLLLIHGVLPYFYCPITPRLPRGCNNQDQLRDLFRIALNIRMRHILHIESKKQSDFVLFVDIVDKISLMNFSENKSQFFKITLAVPAHVPTARKILEEGLEIGSGVLSYQTFESNIPFVLRFMVDHGINGAAWVKIPEGKWEYVNNNKIGETQIEIECSYKDLYPVTDNDESSKIAPLRILSFDIECSSKPGSFPNANEDPVIQIANFVTELGDEKHSIKNVFVLGLCSPIIGTDIRCYSTEKELLLAWRDFVIKTDPDIITGYNILNFDIPYLLDRSTHFKIDKEFYCLSRLKDTKLKIKEAKFSSNQTGTRESKEVSLYGRVIFDILQVMQREFKLSSYTLNSVSAHFLGQQKEDVHYSIISKLFAGSPDDRRRLASYCSKDAYLPLRLLNNLMLLINYIEMARVTGVPFSFLLSRGQGIKVVSQLLRKIYHLDIIAPTISGVNEQTYEGAHVISPRIGFYAKPIPTLDFVSLYPSIMMAHNLCYTTLLKKGEEKNLDPEDYEESPTGDKFVKPKVRKGVLPQILEDLLGARAKVKEMLRIETDDKKKKVYNARQLALKISANSVYGFTGQAKGALPCVEISASVTSYGREMIKTTKEVIEGEYTIKNGYKSDAEIIYGDTDSVMVNFGVDSIEEAIALGKQVSKLVSSKFPPPIQLDFEKVYYPWLLMSKKRYAGLWWTKPDKWDKMDTKGLESVRRDNCALVRHVIEKLLKKILIERDIEGATNFAKGVIKDLLQNKVDLSLLIITKSLTKSKEKYSNPQAHVMLAERIQKRSSAANAPNIGDRIPYVIVQKGKEAKTWEKAEDPIYVLENGLAIDAQYYLDKQLGKPLCRIFKSLMDNPQATLLSGEHTRQLAIPTPTTGPIVGWTRLIQTCLGCRATLVNGEKTLCTRCKEDAPAFYQNFLNRVRTKETEFSRLWTQCQNCQGSFHQEVLCTARDCPIFYLRTKTMKDLDEARNNLEKFSDLSW